MAVIVLSLLPMTMRHTVTALPCKRLLTLLPLPCPFLCSPRARLSYVPPHLHGSPPALSRPPRPTSHPHSSHIRNGPSRTQARPSQHAGADGEKPHGVPGARHPATRPPPRPCTGGDDTAGFGVGDAVAIVVGVTGTDGGAVAAPPPSPPGAGPPQVDGSSSPTSSPVPTCVSTKAVVHAPPREHVQVTHLRIVHAASGASAGAPGG